MVGTEIREVVEDRGRDRLEEAADLNSGLLVARSCACGRAIVAGPELVAGEVCIGREELVPGVAVERPLGREESREGLFLLESAALRAVEVEERVDGQRAPLPKERLGLGDDVVGLPRETGLDPRRLLERGRKRPAALEGVEELLGGDDVAVVGERPMELD